MSIKIVYFYIKMLDLHIKISPWESSEFFLDFWPWLRILGSMAFNFSMGVTEGPEVVFFKDYFGYNQGRPAPFLKGKQRGETGQGPKKNKRARKESQGPNLNRELKDIS